MIVLQNHIVRCWQQRFRPYRVLYRVLKALAIAVVIRRLHKLAPFVRRKPESMSEIAIFRQCAHHGRRNPSLTRAKKPKTIRKASITTDTITMETISFTLTGRCLGGFT